MALRFLRFDNQKIIAVENDEKSTSIDVDNLVADFTCGTDEANE